MAAKAEFKGRFGRLKSVVIADEKPFVTIGNGRAGPLAIAAEKYDGLKVLVGLGKNTADFHLETRLGKEPDLEEHLKLARWPRKEFVGLHFPLENGPTFITFQGDHKRPRVKLMYFPGMEPAYLPKEREGSETLEQIYQGGEPVMKIIESIPVIFQKGEKGTAGYIIPTMPLPSGEAGGLIRIAALYHANKLAGRPQTRDNFSAVFINSNELTATEIQSQVQAAAKGNKTVEAGWDLRVTEVWDSRKD